MRRSRTLKRNLSEARLWSLQRRSEAAVIRRGVADGRPDKMATPALDEPTLVPRVAARTRDQFQRIVERLEERPCEVLAVGAHNVEHFERGRDALMNWFLRGSNDTQYAARALDLLSKSCTAGMPSHHYIERLIAGCKADVKRNDAASLANRVSGLLGELHGIVAPNGERAPVYASVSGDWRDAR